MYKKLFLLISFSIPFVSSAIGAVVYNGIPGPWYTYWLKSLNIDFFIIIFIPGVVLTIIFLGLLSLFFKEKCWNTFIKLLKGFTTLIILGNIIWFLFANIYSQFNPYLNRVYSDLSIPSIPTVF